MRIHVLQHADFETEAAIGLWAKKKQFQVTRTLLFNNEKLPSTDTFDLLCIMGGPMNIYEDNKYPFLKAEKKFLKKTILAKKKILGICLGAQLLAEAFGAVVFKNEYKEIGWHPVIATKDAEALPCFKNIPKTFNAFHWHGDTFTLPDNAIHIFQSEACINQGFVINSNSIALQFHLEMTIESIRKIMLNCKNDITSGLYIESAAAMNDLQKYREFSQVTLMIMEQILNSFQKTEDFTRLFLQNY